MWRIWTLVPSENVWMRMSARRGGFFLVATFSRCLLDELAGDLVGHHDHEAPAERLARERVEVDVAVGVPVEALERRDLVVEAQLLLRRELHRIGETVQRADGLLEARAADVADTFELQEAHRRHVDDDRRLGARFVEGGELARVERGHATRPLRRLRGGLELVRQAFGHADELARHHDDRGRVLLGADLGDHLHAAQLERERVPR